MGEFAGRSQEAEETKRNIGNSSCQKACLRFPNLEFGVFSASDFGLCVLPVSSHVVAQIVSQAAMIDI